MSDKLYRLCEFRIDGRRLYVVWFASDKDGLVRQSDGKIASKHKVAALQPAARGQEPRGRNTARKKLIHAMSQDIDRPINRAVVVGCAISATRNYLKLHMSRTLEVLSGNTHAETLKLCTQSRPPIFEFPQSRSSFKFPYSVSRSYGITQ